MRNLVAQLLTNTISRRDFVRRLVATGVTTAAANSILDSVTAMAQAPGGPPAPEAIRVFMGTGGEHFAEQLIASGVKYVFGNSASEDAHFYEALVDRPQLQYVLTPHEGPGAAMAAGALRPDFNRGKRATPALFFFLCLGEPPPRGPGRLGGRPGEAPAHDAEN